MAISRSDMERQLRNMGGIMSLQDPRQGYFLGRLVKKAKRAVKKVVKSPIGKAAILAGLTGGLGGLAGKGSIGSFFGKGSFNPLKALITKGPQTGMFGTSGLGRLLGKFGLAKGTKLTGLGKIAGIGGLSGLAGLMAAREQDDEEEFDLSKVDRGEGLNIADIAKRARLQDPEFRFLPGAEFTGAYAEGGEVDKKTTMIKDMLDRGADDDLIKTMTGASQEEINSIKTTQAEGKAEGGGVGSLAMNEENVKQKFVSDEAGAIPKKGGGVTPNDMGKLKQSDFDSEEDYQRYLRQLNKKARGGITELDAGAPDIKLEGDVKPENMKMARSNMMNKRRDAFMAAFDAAIDRYMSINDVDAVPIDIQEGIFKSLQRKMLGRAEGGLMNLDGLEMDLRGGGFVPIGAKEKADDVPARLSKNEFVMTADAVRAAGGGSVDKGADKMYNLMKDLEAKV